MTGLEKIIAQIGADADAKSDEIMLNAKQKARSIVAERKMKASEDAEKLISEAEQKAAAILSGAKAGSEALSRGRYLEVKNAVVNDIISAAFEEITGMEDAEYFELLLKLLKKYIEPGQCTMQLGEADLARLPKGFEDKVNGEVYETAAVRLSDEPARFSNGFVLKYPDFEINCSIKALFEEKMDDIKDMLCARLFD